MSDVEIITILNLDKTSILLPSAKIYIPTFQLRVDVLPIDANASYIKLISQFESLNLLNALSEP